MGGIFGGLLTLIQMLGGCFLFLLVGSKAWKDTSNGDLLRTMFGGMIFGALVGTALHLFAFPKLDLISGIVIGVILGYVFTLVLRGLKALMG